MVYTLSGFEKNIRGNLDNYNQSYIFVNIDAHTVYNSQWICVEKIPVIKL